MNIKLTTHIIEIIQGTKVFELFDKSNIRVITVSDFLALDKKYTEENEELLKDIIRRLNNNDLKMDYELDEDELKERTRRRKEIHDNLKEKRSKINLEEELNKDINIVLKGNLNNKDQRILTENGIETVRDILQLSHYELLQIFKQNKVKNIEKCLSSIGLEIKMITPLGKVIGAEEFAKTTEKEVETPQNEEKETTETVQKPKEKTSKQEDSTQTEKTAKLRIIWLKRYRAVKLFRDYHKHIFIPKGYIFDGVDLGKWLANQRQRVKRRNYPEEYRDLLTNLGIIWEKYNSETGKDLKQYTLTKNKIKQIIVKGNEIITIFENGTSVSTNDESFQKELSKITEKSDTTTEITDSSEEEKHDTLETEKTNNPIDNKPEESKNASYYREKLDSQEREIDEINDEINALKEKIETIKQLQSKYLEYSNKYNHLVEIIERFNELGKILNCQEETNISQKLENIGLLKPAEIIKMNMEEVTHLIQLIDKTIETVEDSLLKREEEVERISKEKQEKIEKLKATREKLLKEFNELNSQVFNQTNYDSSQR